MAAAWAIMSMAITLLPSALVPVSSRIAIANYDVAIHGIIFMVFSFLLILSFKHEKGWKPVATSPALMAVLFSAFYGITLEIIQIYIPGRGLELSDILANLVGAFLGYGLYWIFRKSWA